jgi:hypothetical protein
MVRLRYLVLTFILIVPFFCHELTFDSVSAQSGDYSFEVLSETVEVTILSDGSIDIEYLITFRNYGKMDGVDIGLPNEHYDRASAEAKIYIDNSSYLPRLIRVSPYVEVGLAVELDTTTRESIEFIDGGKEFTLWFKVNNPHMVYEDEVNKNNAGMRFRPTWFNSEFQIGPTEAIHITVFLPQRLNSTQSIRYLEGHPYDLLDFNETRNRYYAQWHYEDVTSAEIERGDADVGISFPKDAVDRYYTPSDLEESVEFFAVICAMGCLLAPFLVLILIFIFILNYYKVHQKSRMDYFEPELSVVGAGPRRDLTAVEAAVVLERPLDKIATMILFGLRKKQKVTVFTEVPLVLQVNPTHVSAEPLHRYELDFLSAITSNGTIWRPNLEITLVNLIKNTQYKLRGFDLAATQGYYRYIVGKAWAQVMAARTPPVFQKTMEEQDQWLLVDEHYNTRISSWLVHDHGYEGHHSSGASYSPPSGGTPSITEMAQGFVMHVENTCKGLVGDLESFTKGVSDETNPVSSGGSGGGFSSGGSFDSCACACAGGGR